MRKHIQTDKMSHHTDKTPRKEKTKIIRVYEMNRQANSVELTSSLTLYCLHFAIKTNTQKHNNNEEQFVSLLIQFIFLSVA